MKAYQDKKISEKDVIYEMGCVLAYTLKALDEAGVRVMVETEDRKQSIKIKKKSVN